MPRVHGETSRICNILLKTSGGQKFALHCCMKKLLRYLGFFSAAAFLFGQSPLEPRVVRAIDYENFGPVTVTEAQQALRQKEIELRVEGGWEPNRVEAARAALTALLAAHGMRGARVYVLISEIPPRSVGITFRAAR